MPHRRTARPATRRTPGARARLGLRMPLVVAAALGIALTGSTAPALALDSAPSAVRIVDVEPESAAGPPTAPSSAGPDAADLPAHVTLALALLAAGITAVGMVRRPERP
ncbi:hypothetical protein QFZ62_001690 [Clavibacter sp. B3I6]|uniref:hypothetical protein n=1 Tax=Clavibacter sp. B3I6 TaxID=3042268 RepID=UPI00277F1AA4|nr:hypothetical protein [Clavibacter sp. B3I6]MDQ0744382.1 hypothetical protein [Clavibacter sp. B3I6]